MIKTLYQLWKRRNTPEAVLLEEHALLIRGARRCAYDLRHASTSLFLHSDDQYDMFEKRADMWLNIFSPDGVKNYRHQLHKDIEELEREVDRLQKVCEANDVDHKDPNALPF